MTADRQYLLSATRGAQTNVYFRFDSESNESIIIYFLAALIKPALNLCTEPVGIHSFAFYCYNFNI